MNERGQGIDGASCIASSVRTALVVKKETACSRGQELHKTHHLTQYQSSSIHASMNVVYFNPPMRAYVKSNGGTKLPPFAMRKNVST